VKLYLNSGIRRSAAVSGSIPIYVGSLLRGPARKQMPGEEQAG
jgi:hypothetical protein